MARGFDQDFIRFVRAQSLSQSIKETINTLYEEVDGEEKVTSKNTNMNHGEKEKEGGDNIKEHTDTGVKTEKSSDKNRSDSTSEVSSFGSFPGSEVIPGVTQLDILVALARIGCKIVIFHGDKDKIVPLSNSQLMQKLVYNKLVRTRNDDVKSSGDEVVDMDAKIGIDLVIMPGIGHVPQEEDPEGLFVEIRKKVNIGVF